MAVLEDAKAVIEAHPAIATGAVVAVLAFAYAAHVSKNPASNLPFAQQLALIRANSAANVAAINAQNRPAIASTQAQTAVARIAAGVQNLQSRLGLSAIQNTNATQVTEEQNQTASTDYLEPILAEFGFKTAQTEANDQAWAQVQGASNQNNSSANAGIFGVLGGLLGGLL